MMGSSAAAINMWYIEDLSNGTLATFAKRSYAEESSALSKRQDNAVPLQELAGLLSAFNSTFVEPGNLTVYASWPNPFAGLNTTTPVLRKEPYIKLVDGSENGQVDPLWSMIQPVRGLDFIITWDNGGDARPSGWNNGTTVYKTYQAAKVSSFFGLPPKAP
jgi:lysophospholipase